MSPIVYWLIMAAIMLVVAGFLGRFVSFDDVDDKGNKVETKGHWLGILIDHRKRFSLTHFQTVTWTIVILSLLAAIFVSRLASGKVTAVELMNFEIPQNILFLLGISGGSAVLSAAVKSTKNTEAIRTNAGRTQFSQIFMVEEGESADEALDITKFQNFFLTLIAVVAYVTLATHYLTSVTYPDRLPDIGQGLVSLIGLSHATYVGGKIPGK